MGMTTDELYFKPRLQVINEAQIAQLHEATLDVLQRTGVKITHPKALEILAGAGHDLPAVHPELVNQKVIAFLEDRRT